MKLASVKNFQLVKANDAAKSIVMQARQSLSDDPTASACIEDQSMGVSQCWLQTRGSSQCHICAACYKGQGQGKGCRAGLKGRAEGQGRAACSDSQSFMYAWCFVASCSSCMKVRCDVRVFVSTCDVTML